MKEVEFTKDAILIKGREDFLLCGEIHYFRIDPAYWSTALDQLKNCGCNAVALYIPWFVHEPEEGSFDFTGKLNERFNLVKFLDMIKTKNLMAFVRPGPYIYAETSDLGIPSWYYKNYPDSVVKCWKDGKLQKMGENAAPHNNPVFLKCAAAWYKKVCEIIKPYQEPDGPVFMVQACNEIPGPDCDDQNPETLGIGKSNGLYPSYLKKKYITIENLNKKYSLNFLRFEDVQPVDLIKNSNLSVNEHLEFYYTYYYPEYFKKLISLFRENGITVQIVHNAYNPRAVSLHYHTKKQIPELFIGVDCYYSMQGSLNAKSLSYYCEFGAEALKSMLGCVPVVIEEECGYWNDDPPVYGPELYDFIAWTFAAGFRGINMYLFAGGSNLHNMGYFGTSHEWQAPVNEKGEQNENFIYIKSALDLVKGNKEAFMAQNIYDIAIGIYNEPGMIWKNVSRSCVETKYMMFMDNLNCRICDIEKEPLEKLLMNKLLWVVVDGVLPDEIQKKLISYAKCGGHLVIQGRFPETDINQNSALSLKNELKANIVNNDLTPGSQTKIIIGWKEIYIGKKIQKAVFDGKTLAENMDGSPAVIIKKYNSGSITVIPFELEYKFKAQEDIINTVLKECNVKANVKALKLRCILKKSKDMEYAFVLNYHPVAVNESILIYGKSIEFKMKPYEIKIIEIND